MHTWNWHRQFRNKYQNAHIPHRNVFQIVQNDGTLWYCIETAQEMISKAAAISPCEVVNTYQQILTPWFPRSLNRNCIDEQRIMHDYVRILTARVCVSVIELSNLQNGNLADWPSLLNGNSCVSAELPFGFSNWRDFCPIRWIGQNHPCKNMIELQPHISTENSSVKWLRCLIAKQSIHVQFLLKSLIFLKMYFCWIRLIRRELWKKLDWQFTDK